MEKIEFLIGKKIRAARLKAGLSQTALAKAAKTSLTTINRLEKGHQFPHSSTLNEIARVLGLSPAEIYQPTSLPQAMEERIETLTKSIEDMQSILQKVNPNQAQSVSPQRRELLDLVRNLPDTLIADAISDLHTLIAAHAAIEQDQHSSSARRRK